MNIIKKMNPLYFKITFILTLMTSSIYLYTHDFLSTVNFNQMKLIQMDSTNIYYEYNQFILPLLLFSFLLLCIYFLFYLTIEKKNLGHRFFLFYFIFQLIILLFPYILSGATLEDYYIFILFISSLTFLQFFVLPSIPMGLIVYIPLLYVIFKKTT